MGVWGELASHKRLFNPLPQFSRLGTRGPAPMLCCVVCLCLGLCVYVGDGGGGFLSVFLGYLAGMQYTIIPCIGHEL